MHRRVCVALSAVEVCIFKPYFRNKYNLKADVIHNGSKEGIKLYQYAFTERNTSKYLSAKFIWPSSLHRPPSIPCCLHLLHGLNYPPKINNRERKNSKKKCFCTQNRFRRTFASHTNFIWYKGNE
mmetsp:Transcript_4353/g.5719  ORF Transcript_4353/g.5719 Transcript_4353/m.5719 type:complete len:125 (-) Transcript_4353:734-1108(-)